MNSIKKIAFFALTAALLVSCNDKKENMETPEGSADTTMTDATAAANVETTSFKIDGMVCPDGCAAMIERKLAALEGVEDANVDFDNKTATISYDAEKQTPETLVSTVENIPNTNGAYKVSDVHSSADKAYYGVDQEKEKTKKADKKNDKSCSSGEKKEGSSCCGGAKKCSSETKKPTTM